MHKNILFFIFALLLFSCEKSAKKDYKTLPVEIFLSGGLEREYMLYIPPSAQKNIPLVFILHGLGSTNTIIMNYSQMNLVADKYGFAVC